MEKHKSLIAIIACIAIILLLSIVDIGKFLNGLAFLETLKANINWLTGIVGTYSSLLIVLVIVFLIIWVLCMFTVSLSNATILGIEFQLKNPDKIVRCNIRNFLSTKRSLFSINEKYDNFCEVFDSYHDIYEFLRRQLLEYEICENYNSETYTEIVEMVGELNEFLSENQSHFRKWIAWFEENNKDYIPLFEEQKKYPNYNELMQGFAKINAKMNKHANKFEIKIIKLDTYENDVSKGDEQ